MKQYIEQSNHCCTLSPLITVLIVVNALVKGQLSLQPQVSNQFGSLKDFFQLKFLMHGFCTKALCRLIIGYERKGLPRGGLLQRKVHVTTCEVIYDQGTMIADIYAELTTSQKLG